MNHRGNLLIVDDDPGIVFYLKMLFQEESYAVRTASFGVEALRLLDHLPFDIPFDILLTDIQMPGMNGFELIGQARLVQPDLQCIVLSGYQEAEFARETVNLGVTLLPKPINFQKLEAMVSQKMEEVRSARKLRKNNRKHLPVEQRPEMRILQSIVSICASCKNIRDERGDWREIEAYICDHTEVQFSHGICPGCAMRLDPGVRFAEKLQCD